MQHLIVGGGPVGTNAIEAIREFDPAAEITLVCDEPAHSRMALPYWLSGQIPREQTHTADDAFFQRMKVTARIGSRVQSVHPAGKTVTLADGTQLKYDRLLIGTGASPRSLAIPGSDLAGVQNLWSLAHTQSLLDAAQRKPKPRIVMIGAGFIGFIMLNAMHKRGWQLTVVERESQVLPRMLDAGAADLAQAWLGAKGIALHCGASVRSITAAADGSRGVELDNGRQLLADVVIVAVGIQPNVDFLQGSGVQIDRGILVNDRMQTNVSEIYAGGDVAQGPALYSDGRQIHPIHPTAVDHGRIAGANMAGRDVRYRGSLSMNILDVCGLQTASLGSWEDGQTEAMTISSPAGHVYRKLLWRGEQLVGAIFVGRANDMGMLTDLGMVKGILQTETPLGAWKDFLAENPFDIRRAYIASGVAQTLAKTTLLGRPTQARQFHFGGATPSVPANAAHATYLGAKTG